MVRDKMRGVRTTSALLLLAIAGGACAHGPTAAPAAGAPADFFPLAVGNEWVYADRSPQLSVKDQESRQRTVRILSRDKEGYFLDNEKGALRADPDCLHDRLRRLLCKPFEPGNAWSSVVSVGSTERYEIVAVGERVQTLAGTFDGCLRVRAFTRAGADAEAVLEITYAPRVGPVRIETFAVVKGVVTPQVRAELKWFRVEGR
jgi:hypothetical protein